MSRDRVMHLTARRMPHPGRRPFGLAAVGILAAAAALGVAVGRAADPTSASPGNVRFVEVADSDFDPYTENPSAAQQAWMRAHYWRMLAYPPYFDSRLSWFPDAWFYKDLYAIYPSDNGHPEWILRDGGGNWLYIPYACGGGTCPQYAADIGNPAFRASWIADARARMAAGYRGVFIDDMNLRMMVSNGNGNLVAPWDPRLGRYMTTTDWRSYVADFAEEIRAALPDAEIVHNEVYFFAPLFDRYHLRTLGAADIINVERGFNDGGLRGGNGTWGFETLMTYVDVLHFFGRGVIYDVTASGGREYALAMYFLLQHPRDSIGNSSTSLPNAWWSGNDVDLGRPASSHYPWNGVWRKDFSGGLVLVNEPEAPTRTLSLGRTYRRLDGTLVNQVTLGPADGVVLVAG